MATKNQVAVIKRSNKYGVVYDIPTVTVKSMLDKGLIQNHTNHYGQMHGYKLTSKGWEIKRDSNV